MDGYCLAQLFEEEPAAISCPSTAVGHLGLMLPDQTYGFPPTARGDDLVVIERRIDDTYCWVCGAAIVDVHCKIVCKHCGFMRDCSDP